MPSVSIKFKDQDEQVIEVESEKILFDELEDRGITLPHGCLAGSCGSCRIIVTEGASNLSEKSYIENDTIDSLKGSNPDLKDKELRLSCRSKITGDIKILIP